MDPTQTSYGVTRCYLQDRKTTLPNHLYNKLHGYIRARRYQELASCATDSLHDVTSKEGVRTLLQIEAFFKKNVCFTDPLAARLSALISFESGEDRCAETNERLDHFYTSPSDFPEKFSVWVNRSMKYIDQVLGEHSSFLGELPKFAKVTAGATATKSRRRALPFLKVNKRMVCTPGAFPYLDTLSNLFGYGPLQGRLVTSNRVEFVPKSWKTDRTIACEPDGNIPLQLAFDGYVKRRLIRVGINLFDQTRNQELAREGSCSDKLSTIDLSQASDTLAYNTVALLLPGEWFRYLRSIRSQYYSLYPNHRKTYHKFSSMGNGATFTLETLVFAAACYSVGAGTYSVYGDDIIIDSNKAPELLEYLDFLGFIPNIDKTFTSGPIRESCGAFWYLGDSVLPIYIRELDSRKTTQCHLVNTLMTIAEPYGALEDYLYDLVVENGLPLVPHMEDTMGGVWIDVYTAYAKKLIRSKFYVKEQGRRVETFIPKVKAYIPKSRSGRDYSIRSLFLWYLGTLGERLPLGSVVRKGHGLDVVAAYQSSRYAISSHRYVRKWVHWTPVVNGPDHLHRWSERFTRQ